MELAQKANKILPHLPLPPPSTSTKPRSTMSGWWVSVLCRLFACLVWRPWIPQHGVERRSGGMEDVRSGGGGGRGGGATRTSPWGDERSAEKQPGKAARQIHTDTRTNTVSEISDQDWYYPITSLLYSPTFSDTLWRQRELWKQGTPWDIIPLDHLFVVLSVKVHWINNKSQEGHTNTHVSEATISIFELREDFNNGLNLCFSVEVLVKGDAVTLHQILFLSFQII